MKLLQSKMAVMGMFVLLGVAGTAWATFTQTWSAPIVDDNRGVAWADFNRDCKPDLIFVNNQPGSCVRIYRNDGGGNFTLMYTSPQLDRCMAVSVADYDGDGLPDFAVANYSGIPSRVYHNDGNFNFHVAWSEPYAEYSTGVAWGDYDNDGKPDLAINTGTISGVRIFHNDGGGNFSFAGSVTTPGNSASVTFCDYNKDGYLDLFEGVTGWGSVIYRGNGTAGFVLAKTLPWNNNDDSDWADFDKDGFPDLVETEYPTIFRYAGGNNFTQIWTSGDSQFVKAADYDNDGFPDLAISDWWSTNFSIWHNNSSGSSFNNVFNVAGTGGGPVAWADYDGDGGMDVISACFQGSSNVAKLYHNDSPGAVTPIPCVPFYTATISPTFSVSPTQTRSVTFSPTPTVSPTCSVTPTRSSTFTVTPTFTISSTPTVSPTGIPDNPAGKLEIIGIYPHPVPASGAIIAVMLPMKGDLSVRVYTLKGQLVKAIDKTFVSAGSYEIAWDAKNDAGNAVAFGSYYLHIILKGSVGDAKVSRWITVKR